jgi:hypothetical protein
MYVLYDVHVPSGSLIFLKQQVLLNRLTAIQMLQSAYLSFGNPMRWAEGQRRAAHAPSAALALPGNVHSYWRRFVAS